MNTNKYVEYVQQCIATQTIPMTAEQWNTKQLNYPVVKVISVSSNTNTFGLYGVIILSTTGIAYEIGVSNPPRRGRTFESRFYGKSLMEIYGLSYEIPKLLDKAVPLNVIEQTWGKVVAKEVAEARGEAVPDNTCVETRPSAALMFSPTIYKDLI